MPMYNSIDLCTYVKAIITVRMHEVTSHNLKVAATGPESMAMPSHSQGHLH